MSSPNSSVLLFEYIVIINYDDHRGFYVGLLLCGYCIYYSSLNGDELSSKSLGNCCLYSLYKISTAPIIEMVIDPPTWIEICWVDQPTWIEICWVDHRRSWINLVPSSW